MTDREQTQGRGDGAAAPGTGPPTISSAQLLAGSKEILIRHGDELYRLKLTGNNKLILTK